VNQENHKHYLAWALWSDHLATVRLPQKSLSSQSLGNVDNLTRTTKRQNI